MKYALTSLVAPVLAAGVVSGLVAAKGEGRHVAATAADPFSLVGKASPWRSEWVLALSDCTACSVRSLDLPAIERKIGKRTVLLAMNRDDETRLRKGHWASVDSKVPASEFGARLTAVVPRLLRLGPDGTVLQDVPGAQPIRETVAAVRP